MITLSAWHMWDHIWSGVSGSGFFSAQRMWARNSGVGAQGIRGKAEKVGSVHPADQKAKGKPYWYLQLPDKKMQRRWWQAFLGCAQRKAGKHRGGNENKIEHWKIYLGVRKIFFVVRDVKCLKGLSFGSLSLEVFEIHIVKSMSNMV